MDAGKVRQQTLWHDPCTICWVATICVALVGFHSVFRAYWSSGFDRVQGDLGDTRFVMLCVEHVYRWATGGGSVELFSPRWLFYPEPQTLAYSDTMIASLPLYLPWRMLGADPIRAFQLFVLSSVMLNFGMMLLLLSRLGVPLAARLAGGYLFAFAIPRVAFANHPQLTLQFFSPLVLVLLHEYWRAPFEKRSGPWLWGAAGVTACMFYGSIYQTWFFGTGILGMGAVLALWRDSWRKAIWEDLRAHPWRYLVALGVLVAVAYPVASRYLQVAAMTGKRGYLDSSAPYQPKFWSLFVSDRSASFYGWLNGDNITQWTQKDLGVWHEKVSWAGLIAFLTPYWMGWRVLRWRDRSETVILPGVVQGAVIIALVCLVSYHVMTIKVSTWTLWSLIHQHFPGGNAISAVGRVVLAILLPWSVLLAVWIGWSRTGMRRPVVQWALLGLVMLENHTQYDSAYSRSEQVARHAQATRLLVEAQGKQPCAVFHFHGDGPGVFRELDASWVSLQTGVPTVNGYTGASPRDRLSAQPTAEEVVAFAARRGVSLRPEEVCLIRSP